MVKEKKSTTHYKGKHLAAQVVGEKAVKKYRDKEKKKEVKKKKNESKREKEAEEAAALSKEVAAFLSSIKSKKSSALQTKASQVKDYLKSDLVDDSDDDFDYGESDDDAEVMLFGDDDNVESFDVGSDDDDDEDDEEAVADDEDEVDELNEDDYDDTDLLAPAEDADDEDAADDDEDMDDEDAMEDEDEDAFDDDVDDEAVGGGVFETIDDEYNVDSDEDDEANMDADQLMEKHKRELEQLKKADPELYKHLSKNAKGLLEFGETEEDQAIMEAEKPASQDRTLIESLTKESYLELRKPFDNNSFSAKHLVKLVRMLKSAAIVRQISQKGSVGNGKKSVALTQKRASDIVSTKLFNHFLQFALRTIPTAMIILLMRSSDLGDKIPKGDLKAISIALSDGPTAWSGSAKQLAGWSKVYPLAQAYYMSVASLLNEEIDSMILRFVMRTMLPAIPLMEDIQTAPKVLKALLRIWSLGADIATLHKDENGASKFGIDHASRIDAFLAIRRMCLTLPPNSLVLEATLKGIYLSYVRVAKHVHAHTMPSLIFLTNCVTEIYGIDQHSSYQHAFVYIRQMAIHVRSAILKPSEQTLRSVYNWQFINCLRVWCNVLAIHATDANCALYPLIYPVIQIALAVIELSTSSAYFPVRFQVIGFLNQLARNTNTYIPLSPYLLSVFNSSLLKDSDKSSSKASNSVKKRVNDIKYKLHVSSGVLNSSTYKELVVNNTMDLLTNHLASISQSIAFPEIALPIKYLLKKYMRDSKYTTGNRLAKQTLSAINDNINYIQQLRLSVQFSPKDLITNGIDGLTTFSHPELLVKLNQSNKTAGDVKSLGKTFKTKVSPLEQLWNIRMKNLDMIAREEVVLSAQKRNEELDAHANDDDDDDDDAADDEDNEEFDDDMLEDEDMDDEDGMDDDDDDDDDEEEEHVFKTRDTKKKTKNTEQEQIPDNIDIDDIEEMDDQVEDFVLSDASDDEVVVPSKKAKKNNAKAVPTKKAPKQAPSKNTKSSTAGKKGKK